MRGAKVVFDEVRAAQELLGSGEIDESLERAAVLRTEALKLRERTSLTSFERSHADAAFVYSTVTLILGAAERDAPALSAPYIRSLAVSVCREHRDGTETWKVLAAAAEMLARAGDAMGAAWAAKKARQVGDGGDYLVRLAGGIASMYPQVFADLPDEVPDEPPPPRPD